MMYDVLPFYRFGRFGYSNYDPKASKSVLLQFGKI